MPPSRPSFSGHFFHFRDPPFQALLQPQRHHLQLLKKFVNICSQDPGFKPKNTFRRLYFWKFGQHRPTQKLFEYLPQDPPPFQLFALLFYIDHWQPGPDPGFAKRGGRVSKLRENWLIWPQNRLNLHNLVVKRGTGAKSAHTWICPWTTIVNTNPSKAKVLGFKQGFIMLIRANK